MNPNQTHPYIIGQNYFIRTVTHAHTGRLVAVHEHELTLEDAAWIADTGRFADAMASGSFSEIEPWPDGVQVIINRQSVIDASILRAALPRKQQ